MNFESLQTAAAHEQHTNSRVVKKEELSDAITLMNQLLEIGVYIVLIPVKGMRWIMVRILDNDDTIGNGPTKH